MKWGAFHSFYLLSQPILIYLDSVVFSWSIKSNRILLY
ncbi:Uncharacterised protein [Vibrio cholerae]|nr:Uncharacterised protein [Vibrio cholerae]